jgi:hypothetical protein
MLSCNPLGVARMPTPKEYVKRSDHCIDLANRATDPKERDLQLRLAKQWLRLAKNASDDQEPEN